MTIKVKIVADSINLYGNRITSFEIYYPRFLTAEINTHGLLAKSTASSRAIPVKKRINMVRNDPYIPKVFGKNRSGMQSTEDISEQEEARKIWKYAMDDALYHAKFFLELNVHKQIANRLLEPFVHVHTILTATEWYNFFKLRTHKDAQPEFQELTKEMQRQYDENTPKEVSHHLPYISFKELNKNTTKDVMNISSARCARVSYKTFDGNKSTIDKDLVLCNGLLDVGHYSPFDHPAISTNGTKEDEELTGRFKGWIPYRNKLES